MQVKWELVLIYSVIFLLCPFFSVVVFTDILKKKSKAPFVFLRHVRWHLHMFSMWASRLTLKTIRLLLSLQVFTLHTHFAIKRNEDVSQEKKKKLLSSIPTADSCKCCVHACMPVWKGVASWMWDKGNRLQVFRNPHFSLNLSQKLLFFFSLIFFIGIVSR